MADDYAALLQRYRGSVRHLHDALVAHLTHEGMAADDVTSALDHLYEQASGKSATLWALLEDVQDPAEALPLSAAVLVWLALTATCAAVVGPWVLSEAPQLPTQDELARVLKHAWELEHGEKRDA
jgi:hypothetical protein